MLQHPDPTLVIQAQSTSLSAALGDPHVLSHEFQALRRGLSWACNQTPRNVDVAREIVTSVCKRVIERSLSEREPGDLGTSPLTAWGRLFSFFISPSEDGRPLVREYIVPFSEAFIEVTALGRVGNKPFPMPLVHVISADVASAVHGLCADVRYSAAKWGSGVQLRERSPGVAEAFALSRLLEALSRMRPGDEKLSGAHLQARDDIDATIHSAHG